MTIIRDTTIKAEKYLFQDEILLFVGARQAGKTTILKQLQDNLAQQGKKSFFLNLEDPEFLELLDKSPKNLFKIFNINLQEKAFVFIDEIQYLKNPTNFLKYFYDEYKGRIKMIVTGSSAFYIDRKFRDSLAGRKKLFTVSTLSFSEFLRFRQENDLLKVLPASFAADNFNLKKNMAISEYERIKRYFDEYVIFGGYPRVVLSPDVITKKEVLADIAYSYVKKDIYEGGVKREDAFFKLIKILANQIGQLVNANELASTLGITQPTVEHFLYILLKSHHISLVRPFSNNIRKELTKMPKVFFRDIGLRNFFTVNFESMIIRQDRGAVMENIVYRNLFEHFDDQGIKFWRTQGGHEIDFVVGDKYAFEVKYSEKLINRKKYGQWLKFYPKIPLNFVVYEKSVATQPFPVWEPWEI